MISHTLKIEDANPLKDPLKITYLVLLNMLPTMTDSVSDNSPTIHVSHQLAISSISRDIITPLVNPFDSSTPAADRARALKQLEYLRDLLILKGHTRPQEPVQIEETTPTTVYSEGIFNRSLSNTGMIFSLSRRPDFISYNHHDHGESGDRRY